jgi:hypothetical protein
MRAWILSCVLERKIAPVKLDLRVRIYVVSVPFLAPNLRSLCNTIPLCAPAVVDIRNMSELVLSQIRREFGTSFPVCCGIRLLVLVLLQRQPVLLSVVVHAPTVRSCGSDHESHNGKQGVA